MNSFRDLLGDRCKITRLCTTLDAVFINRSFNSIIVSNAHHRLYYTGAPRSNPPKETHSPSLLSAANRQIIIAKSKTEFCQNQKAKSRRRLAKVHHDHRDVVLRPESNRPLDQRVRQLIRAHPRVLLELLLDERRALLRVHGIPQPIRREHLYTNETRRQSSNCR